MAKKKPETVKPTLPKGRPKSANKKGRTRISVTIRASPEWDRWMDRFTEALNRELGPGVKLDRVAAIDVALARTAKLMKIPEPPDRITKG